MITIDRLKYFKAVAELEHVGKAAKACFVSPSVISSAVSTLEQELGCSLFRKENRRLKLNENGRVLLESSMSLLAQLDLIYEEVGTGSSYVKGHYRIGASPFLLKNYLTSYLIKISKAHEDLSLDLMSLDTGKVLGGILGGTLDMGLVFKGAPYNGIEEHVLYEGSICLCARKDHPVFKTQKSKRVSVLNNYPAVTFRPSLDQNIYEEHPLFSKLGLKAKHRYFYNSNDASIEILKSTDAWAFLPDMVIDKYKKSIKVIDLAGVDRAKMNISLVKSKKRTSFLLFDLLKRELEKEFQKLK